MLRKQGFFPLFFLALFLFTQLQCSETKHPPTVQVVTLKGTAYERGLQHGQALKPHIRSLYTRMLTASILPYLNRELLNIAPVLNKYNDPQYQDGNFSLELLKESGRYMEDLFIPEEYIEEMQGIADGADMEYEEVLLLNTFFDTMMSFRSIVLFIQGIQYPDILEIGFGESLPSDGVDNDDDGDTDEEGEGIIEGYHSSPYAKMLEVSPSASLRFVLDDPALGGLACMDLRNAEPKGEMKVKRSCIKERCISPEVKCQNALELGLECLDPRHGNPKCSQEECMDNSCLSHEAYPDCFDNTCLDSSQCLPMEVGEECYRDGCMDEACYPYFYKPDCYNPDCNSEECIPLRKEICIYPRLSADCYKDECIEEADPGCVNPDSIRIYVNDKLYTASDAAIQTNPLPVEEGANTLSECDHPIEVIFKPPEGFPEASVVFLTVQVSDQSPIYSPAPYHNRSMRDERIAFTTKGYLAETGKGEHLYEIPNKGVGLEGKMPTSISFAARGSATIDGEPMLAHHYSLLDNDMVHEHSAVLVHVPEDGHPHATIGYAGLVWGFSGMNDEGLSLAFNNSDTLDNSLVGIVLEEMFKPENLKDLLENPDLEGLSKVLSPIRLLPTGLPFGIAIRETLRKHAVAEDVVEEMFFLDRTYGWNLLVADKEKNLVAIEIDGGTQSERSDTVKNEDGFFFYSPNADDPENLDPAMDSSLDITQRLYSSITQDDIRMSSHYRKNKEDLEPKGMMLLMGIFTPESQYAWTGFYFRSLFSYYELGEVLERYIGTPDDEKKLTIEKAIEILRTPTLVDTRDSMNACIFEPTKLKFHYALGHLPATDSPFVEFDLGAVLTREGVRQ